MFEELVKLKNAERLLKERKFGDVLALVRESDIRDHKRAHDARAKARSGLLDEARADLEAGRIQAAGHKVRMALADGDEPAARELDHRIREAAIRAESEAKAAQRAMREARWHDEHGDRGRARRLVEPFKSPETASFVRGLDESERSERAVRDALLEALRDGASPDGVRARLKDARQSVRDPGLLAEMHGRALEGAVARRDPMELAGLIRDVRAAGIECDALERAAEVLVAAARSAIERGTNPSTVAEALSVFPSGTKADADGLSLKLACWAEGRARAMAARGHVKLATELLARVASALPAAAVRGEDLAAKARAIEATIAEVERLTAAGRLAEARAKVDAAARAEPDAAALQDWADALEACAAEREASRTEALAALEAGDLRRARRAALRLRILGSRPEDWTSLLDQIARRDEEAQRAALEAEHKMMTRGTAAAGPVSAAGVEPMPDFSATPALILAGDPFVLRVENEGDWLVHPGARLTIGNQANGEADLLVLAAIGARHATIERVDASGTASFNITAGAGQRVLRNGKPVTDSALENGDRVQLGHALTFTFSRPNPANATAAIRFHGDFSIQGCSRLVLFSETGRKGSILLAPGSDGHISLRSIDARLEIFRANDGEDAGELFARSPQGVAAGDAPDRAQVRVRASQALAVGALRVHVDRAGNPRRKPRE